jgi:purine-binding chemotaxis protein CheW
MGLPDDEITKKTRIIILTLEQHESIGVLVDEVKEVVTLDEEHIERMGYEKDEKERFLYGVGKTDERLISLLDITSVLSDVVDA